MLTRYLRNITLLLLLTFSIGKAHAQETQSDIDFLKQVQSALTTGVVHDAIKMMKDSVGINFYPAFHIADDSALWPYALELYFDVRIERKEPYVLVKLNLNPSTGKWTDFSSYSVSVSLTQGQQKAVPTTVLVAAEKQLNEILANIGNLREYFGKVRDNVAETIQKLRFAMMDKYFEGKNLPLVRFYPSAEQQFGFDRPVQQEIIGKYKNFYRYDSIQRVPWKALSTSKPDKINAYIQVRDTSFKTKQIRFVNRSDVKLQPFTTKGDTLVFQLTGTSKDQDDELTAEYVETDANGKERKAPIGQVKTIAYQEETNIVHIVPVGVKYPATEKELEKFLNKVYNQAVTNWTVVFDDPIKVNDWDIEEKDGILNIETGIFQRYSDEEQVFIDALEKAKGSIDPKAAYMFVTDVPNNLDARGYMPLSAQFGFIFLNGVEWDTNNEIELLNTTVAHELGHGIYKLKHPWDEYGTQESQTANLLDYQNGTILWKPQWDWIHDPGMRLYMFQKAAEGASATVANMEVIYSAFKNDDGSLTFLTPAGKPITIKEKINWVRFVTLDEDDRWEFDKDFLPMGTLQAFELQDGRVYKAVGQRESTFFYGYKNTINKELYEDKFSSNKKYKNVLVGLLEYNNGNIYFNITRTNYLEEIPTRANVSQLNNGEGDEIMEFEIAKYLDPNSKPIKVHAQLNTKLSINEIAFLNSISKSGILTGRDAVFSFKTIYFIRLIPNLSLCLSEASSELSKQINSTQEILESIRATQFAKVDNTANVNPNIVNTNSTSEKPQYEQDLYYENMYRTYGEYYYNSIKTNNLDLNQSIGDLMDFFDDQNPTCRICLLRQLTFDKRKAILMKHKEWKASPSKESLISDIIATTPNEQFTELLAFLSGKAETGKTWFWSIYSDLLGGNREKFITMITFIAQNSINSVTVKDNLKNYTLDNLLKKDTPNETKFVLVCKKTLFDTDDLNTNDCSIKGYDDKFEVELTDFDEDDNKIQFSYVVTKDVLGPLWESNKNFTVNCGPLTFVKVLFLSNYRFPKCDNSISTNYNQAITNEIIDENQKSIRAGYEIIVPACWLYYILNEQENIRNFTLIRIVGDGIAVVASIYSANPGPFLIVEGLLGGADIAFSILDESIASSNKETLKDVFHLWDNFYMTWGLSTLGTGALKSIVNGSLYTMTKSSMISFVRGLKKTPGKLEKFTVELRTVIGKLNTVMSQIKDGEKYLRPFLMNMYLEAQILLKTNTIDDAAKCFVNNGSDFIFTSTKTNSLEVKIADVIEKNGTIRLENLRWYNQAEHGLDATPVMALEKTAYIKNGDEIVDNLEVVVNKQGQYFMRVSTPEYLRFIDRLADGWDDALRNALRADLITNKNLFNGLNRIEAAEAWRFIRQSIPAQKGTNMFALDAKTLEKVVDIMRENSIFRKKLGENWSSSLREVLIANSDVPCVTCIGSQGGKLGIVGRSHMDELLNDVEYLVANFDVGKGGKGEKFFNWIRNKTFGEGVPNSGQMDEVHQTLSVLKRDGLTADNVENFGKQIPKTSKECDIKKLGNRYHELKNKDFTSESLPKDDVDQVIDGYFRDINSIDDFTWEVRLDKNKAAWGTIENGTDKLKNMWKVRFEADPKRVFSAFNSNIKNELGLTGINAQAKLNALIKDTSSKLYNFIKVAE